MLTIVAAVGCDRSKPQGQGYEQMVFDVDRALLEPTVTDAFLNISIAAPRRWKPVEAAELAQLAARLSESVGKQIPIEPRWIFLDNRSQAACVVSRLDAADIPSEDALLKELESVYTSRFPGATVKGAIFLKDEMRVHQLMITAADFILIKLLLDAPTVPILAVDYIIPRHVYADELRAIESSIGSIRPLSG
jgi:hypothetical protein